MAWDRPQLRINRRDLIVGAAACAMAPAAACSGNTAQASEEPVLRVADFRAAGGSDLEVLGRAFAAWMARGSGTLELERGRLYDLGVKRGTQPVFAFNGLAGARLAGNGATLRIRTVSDEYYPLLVFYHYRGVTIDNLHAEDLGYDGAVRGAEFIRAESGDWDSFDLRLDNVSGDRLLGFLMVKGPAGPRRVRGIHIEPNCRVSNTFYALNCQDQGDAITGGFSTHNCRRSYFPYGVTGHDLVIRVTHDGLAAAPGAESCALIKTYGRPTTDIRLAIAFAGTMPWASVNGDSITPGSCVTLEHHPAADAPPTLIADIDLRIDVAAGTSDPYGAHRLLLRCIGPGGATASGPTRNVWRGIRVRGDLRPGSGPAIFTTSVPTVPTEILVDAKSLPAAAPLRAHGFSVRAL
jgi:hypothetical protein